jgi:hypothetical protein
MAEQREFVDILRDEIAQHEAALERNPTWIKLQAARRTLAAYEGPEPRERRAAPQPKCGLCRKPYSAHRDGNGADASGTITKIKLCPGSTTQTYEPETK